MQKLSQWLYGVSGGWLALAVTVVFVLFMIFVLPDQAAKAEVYSGEAGSPDLSFFYAPEDVFKMAEAYGEEGRAAYVYARFTFDLIFPMVYGAFMLVGGSWALAQVLPVGSRWRWLNLVPFLGVLFDLAENISASVVMAGYPARRALAARLLVIFTPIKFVFVYGSLGLVLVGFVWVGVLWVLGRKQ